MFVGSLMSIIVIPSSSWATTIAYVLEPIVNVSTSIAPSSSSNPFAPSVSVSVTTMFVGSLMSIIVTAPNCPSTSQLVTIAYVPEPIVNVSTPLTFCSLSNPFTPSISVSVTVMSDGVAANASDGNWKRSEDAANNKMKKRSRCIPIFIDQIYSKQS